MKFLTLDTIVMLHARLIAETGGQPGLRDRGLLESAMKAAENRHYYEQATVPVCAAATYAYHLCNAHAFLDGNKRIAAAISEVFLMINGWQLTLDNSELVQFFLGIADGRLKRDVVESIFVNHAVQSPDR